MMLVQVLLGLITASLNSGKERFEKECQGEREGGREEGVMRNDCGLYTIHITHRTDVTNIENQDFP